MGAEVTTSMTTFGISIEDLPLRFDVGNSVVEQLAQCHTPTDILRELVQNEYDAGGHELGVNFEGEWLIIVGNGSPIEIQIVDLNFNFYKRITDDPYFGEVIEDHVFDQYLRTQRNAEELDD